jgi:sodium transport system permease protein
VTPRIDLGVAWTLFRTEVRLVMRDRRTVVLSVVVPSLAFPVMIFASRWSARERERRLSAVTYAYALGGPRADVLRPWLAADEATRKDEDGDVRFREVAEPDPVGALRAGRLEVYAEALAPDDPIAVEACGPALPPAGRRREQVGMGNEPCVRGAMMVRLHFQGNRDQSTYARERMQERLWEIRRHRQAELLRVRGLPFDPEAVATVAAVDLASARQVSGAAVGPLLTVVLVLFLVMGGAVVSSDIVAGEKERGTLETLLTTAAGRGEIVLSKLAGILFVAVATTAIYAANMLLHVRLRVLDPPQSLVDSLTPGVVATVFVLFLPIALLLSCVLLLVSARARTFKEAQLLLQPVLLGSLAPPLAALLPDLELRSALVVVPIANLSVGVRDVLVGRYDWPFLAAAWAVTAGAAAWLVRLSVRTLGTESLVAAGGGEPDHLLPGGLLFRRRLAAWFAGMWGVLLVGSAFLGRADVRLQVLFNLVVVFLGGSLLMLRRYRLDPREALSLRAPPRSAWLAVLIGAPSGFLVGMGVFTLASRLFPVPAKVLEEFQKALLPEGMSLGQGLLFLALLPAVCEEIAFRGMLLHGVRAKLNPVATCLVVGALFGFFHFALFRLVPTAFLGVVLTAVTLLTGSIFPAMAWHGLNNLVGVWLGLRGVSLESVEPRAYAAAAAGLALSLWILWRDRRPGPGSRPGP